MIVLMEHRVDHANSISFLHTRILSAGQIWNADQLCQNKHVREIGLAK
jgi:hypothetical protein